MRRVIQPSFPILTGMLLNQYASQKACYSTSMLSNAEEMGFGRNDDSFFVENRSSIQ